VSSDLYDEQMLKDMARSGLDADDSEKMRTVALAPSKVETLAGKRVAAYKIPYFDIDGRKTGFYRLRSLHKDGGFGKERDGRYWQPLGSAPELYLPPLLDWTKPAKDAAIPIVITEGEKKAAKACKDSIITAAIGGAWNFQSKKRGIALLDAFGDIRLAGRSVELAPDGDRVANSNVRAAFREFGYQLSEREAEVSIVILPINMKLDDYLLKEGYDAYQRLPREPINPKARISLIRNRPKLSGHDRRARIADVCQNTLLATGAAHMVGEEPVIFYRDERRLYSFLTRDDSRLRALFTEQFGINPAEDEYRFVYEQLRGHIVAHGTPTRAATFSHFDKSRAELQIYLGGKAVFGVTPDGYTRVTNGHHGVLFREFDAAPISLKNVRPREKAFRYVMELPNFQGGDRLSAAQQYMLYELHFWSLLFSAGMPTRPLLLLHGEKGSGKSSAALAVALSLFGPEFKVQPFGKDEKPDNLEVALIHNPLVVLDNLDGKFSGMENLLAVASTGGTFTRRVLYTTAEQVKLPIVARIIATSRQPTVFRRDDVRDRTLFLQVQRRVDFVPEAQIQARTLERRPEFWAYVLAQLPEVTAALARHKPRAHPWRMADFAEFCIAVGPVLGYEIEDVEAALIALEGERNDFASRGSALLEGLQLWAHGLWENMVQASGKRKIANEWKRRADERTPVRLTTGELFDAVRAVWARGVFPIHTPESFGIALRNDGEMLADYFEIRREPGHARKTYVTIRPLYNLEESEKAVGGGGGGKSA
jgi:hypothetical protein